MKSGDSSNPDPWCWSAPPIAGHTNIMTMGWHMVLEFTPSLIGCLISSENHSHDMIAESRECVVNIPTVDMARTVAQIGNCSGADVDKFKRFRLTAASAKQVGAPLIAECHANMECRLVDHFARYDLFIFEVVKAYARRRPIYPRTIHYRGEGMFMVSGRSLNLRRLFRPDML